MPLFTVTMMSDGSTNEKDRLSRAIHAASVAAGYPENDLFQRFLSMERTSPQARTDRFGFIWLSLDCRGVSLKMSPRQ